MSVKERVAELLKSLGGTADEVADALRARGITGLREDACRCPIASFIKAEVPEARDDDLWSYDPQDGGWFVCRTYIAIAADDESAEIRPPAAVAEFIEVFDEGVRIGPGDWDLPYSDLEARASDVPS